MRVWILVALCVSGGCAGPVPLDRAIRAEHLQEYEAAFSLAEGTPREAWYKSRAAAAGQSVDAIREADQQLSTTRNPFRANRDPDAVSRGAVIFAHHCARCHGTDVRGRGADLLADHPTADFHAFDKRFAVALHGGAPRTWFRKIDGGFGDQVNYPTGAGPAMPAFGAVLAREQIWLVVTYLQSLEMYAPRPAPAG